MVCSHLQAATNASNFKAKFLSYISSPNLKPFCSASAAERLWPVLFAFQALQRCSRQPSSVSQPFPWKESKACHKRHKERGHSTHKPQSILSLQQTLSWERYIRYMHSSFHSKDICVFVWHWLLSLPGTQSTASDRSMAPDGREASAGRLWGAAKGTTAPGWKQNNSAGVGENQALTALQILDYLF